MKLSLHVLVSPTVSFAFAHAGPRLVVGREPTCELALTAANAAGVSRKHAQIDLTPRGAFVRDLGSVNGTYLNGRRADQALPFQLGDLIRLGPQGPTLRVVGLELGQPHQLVPVAAAPRVAAQQPVAAAAAIAPVAPRVAAQQPVVAAAAVAPRVAARPPVLTDAPAPAAARLPAAVSVTMRPVVVAAQPAPAAPLPQSPRPADSTTRRLVVKLQKRQRGALAGIVAATLACLAMGVCLLSQSGQLSNLTAQTANAETRAVQLAKTASDQAKQLSNLQGQMTEMTEADAANISKRYADAVYLVRSWEQVWDGNQKKFKWFPVHATAFAVDRSGLFATNSHVTEYVKKRLSKGEKVELISQGGKRVYQVTAAKSHPRYTGSPISPDVGLLKVALPAGLQVPTVVELATDEDLRELTPGSALCYIGFPCYGQTDYASKGKDSNLSEVVARRYQGRLNRLLTFTNEQGDFASQQFLEHDMHSFGGASGSPIFNKRGKVVALHNCGFDFRGWRIVGKDQKGNIVNILGSEFAHANRSMGAIRVDLLKELTKSPW